MINRKNQYIYFITLIIILSTNIFDLRDFSGRTQKFFYYPLILYMLYQLWKNKRRITIKKNFSSQLNITTLCVIASCLPCYLYYGQTISGSIIATFPIIGGIIFYHFLHSYRINEQTLITSLQIIALTILCIQIFQQLFPSIAIFGAGSSLNILEGKEVEIRNGLYRFRLGNNNIFCFPILYYAWSKFMSKKTLKDLLLICLMLISTYLLLTRQILATTLITLIIGIFYNKKSNKSTYFFILFIGILLLVINKDIILGDFITKSNDDINNSDYIRYLSAEFFFDQTFLSPLTIICGHCIPVGGSPFETYIHRLWEVGMYSGDVGFIGAAFHYGWIYVITFYFIIYKIFFIYKKYIPPYIKMSILSMTLYSIMIFMFSTNAGIILWAIILYICDVHIHKAKINIYKQ